MTQLEGAVGGASDTVVAAEPTLEDRLSAAMVPEGEEKKPEEEAEGEAGQPAELTVEDLGDDAEGEAGDDLPPIAAPISWKAEEQEEFKQLPRALQETLSRREAEREKFVQSKANEAAQARQHAERDAITQVKSIAEMHEQRLHALLPQVYAEPDPMLQAEDPYAYAEQLKAHKWSLAQYHQVQQDIRSVQAQAKQADDILQQQEQQEIHTRLSKELPEFFDPTDGPKLREKLGSTALALGFPAELLKNVNATEILAMKTATDWKVKADKYDALMAKKMESVREAKNLPRVSRPGVPQGRGAASQAQYQADRQAMRNGDKDAAARAIARHL